MFAKEYCELFKQFENILEEIGASSQKRELFLGNEH